MSASCQKEYESLKKLEKNEHTVKKDETTCVYDFVNEIDCKGISVNYAHYSEAKSDGTKKIFNFLTNLPLAQKNVEQTVSDGRRRWAIENQGFNEQKKHGYYIEHLFSKNCCAMKHHYYLIQIAHMIVQIMDVWEEVWSGIKLSKEQKHRRVLESWKTHSIAPVIASDADGFQIRFI